MDSASLLRLVVDYCNGMSVLTISNKTGLPTSRVKSLLTAAGVEVRDCRQAAIVSHGRHLRAIDWSAVVDDYRRGDSLGLLARKYGATPKAVRDRIRELIPLRSPQDAVRIWRSKAIPNLEHLAAEHLAGATINALAKRIGVKYETLSNRLREAGYPIRTGEDGQWRRVLPTEEIVRRYGEGESVKSLASDFGVARSVIGLRLRASGVELRGTAAAAGNARRRSANRAVTRQKKGLHVFPVEEQVASSLKTRGYETDPQTPCGWYNLDLSIKGSRVAVEIETGPAFRFPQCIATYDRARYVLSAGWSVLYIVTGKKSLSMGAITDRVVEFMEFAKGRHPVYGVIGHDGGTSTRGKHTFTGLERAQGF